MVARLQPVAACMEPGLLGRDHAGDAVIALDVLWTALVEPCSLRLRLALRLSSAPVTLSARHLSSERQGAPSNPSTGDRLDRSEPGSEANERWGEEEARDRRQV